MVKKKAKKDTYSYKGWLVSDRFVKRALAVLGYQMVAALIIYGIIFVLIIILAILFGLASVLSAFF
jgi:hypothetical protein